VRGGLASVKHGDQSNEERHVAGEGAEDECARAVENIARAAAWATPVVVASAATSASGPAGDGRFASGAGGFALDLRRDGSKNRGHGETCEDEFTLTLVLTHRKSETVPEEWEKKVGIEGNRGWREIGARWRPLILFAGFAGEGIEDFAKNATLGILPTIRLEVLRLVPEA
jgi:hypothetical protein